VGARVMCVCCLVRGCGVFVARAATPVGQASAHTGWLWGGHPRDGALLKCLHAVTRHGTAAQRARAHAHKQTNTVTITQASSDFIRLAAGASPDCLPAGCWPPGSADTCRGVTLSTYMRCRARCARVRCAPSAYVTTTEGSPAALSTLTGFTPVRSTKALTLAAPHAAGRLSMRTDTLLLVVSLRGACSVRSRLTAGCSCCPAASAACPAACGAACCGGWLLPGCGGAELPAASGATAGSAGRCSAGKRRHIGE